MLVRSAAEGPQCILQTFGQCDETFAAEHHFGMLPTRKRQPEMIEPVGKVQAGDGDAKRIGIGEVRQALLSRRMLLTKDHLALWAVQRLPGAHPPLQGAPRGDREFRVAAQHLAHDADRAQSRCRLQQRDDLAVPDRRQRVRPAAAAWGSRLRGQPGIGLDPSAGGGAETCSGSGSLARVGQTKVHVQSHLLVRDVFAGHRRSLLTS